MGVGLLSHSQTLPLTSTGPQYPLRPPPFTMVADTGRCTRRPGLLPPMLSHGWPCCWPPSLASPGAEEPGEGESRPSVPHFPHPDENRWPFLPGA